jgi:P27 family predicted phage terminase small subunit
MNIPKNLKKDGKRLFRELAEDFNITDPAGLQYLATAAECLDRMKEAQKEIKRHGVLVEDRYKVLKQNPACGIEKDARNGLLAALKALNLDLEPLKDGPGRPGGR